MVKERFLPGKTERRLVLVILLTSMVPLAAALYLATSMFRQASAIWFDPEIGLQLDRGVDVYKDYVKAIKDDLKHQTVAIAADPILREAAKKRNVETLEAEMDAVFASFPELVSVVVEDAHGKTLARRDRGRPVDESKERSLEVRRGLTEDEEGPSVVATFAVLRKRLDELESAGVVVARYHQLEASRHQVEGGYVNAFAALLGVTFLVTVVLGILLARGVTRRINRLGAAIGVVAQGDLSVRVPVTGSDELTELARTFNRMIAEMVQSRTRIEFLQRMGAWQDMAQRLAHEIKNPLTPIQLAVQEAHKKYGGDDPRYRQLLDTTLEIVEEEVGTLRRLVGNFSNFARLPNAELAAENLSDFLRDCENQLGHLEDPSLGEASADAEPVVAPNVEIRWELPDRPLPVAIDRQMLRRVVVNLVRNAVQAIRDARLRHSAPGGGTPGESAVIGHVVVTARAEDDGAVIEIHDDGPGVPESMRQRIFDPYFTTKADGTGLGLAIVKKIVVEHGGRIEAGESERLGGARGARAGAPAGRRDRRPGGGRVSRALSVLLLATALAGCPKGRTYVVRAYDPAGGKVLGSSVALGAPVTGASATWACPGDALPAEVAKNRAFKPQRDGSLVAAFYEDVAMDCAIELAVPGAGPVRVPVSEVCTEAHGAWCAGLEASVLVARSTGAGLAVVASAIPLDAPRPAGGEITTVLSVVVQADGQILVDGAKVDDAGLSAAATKATAAHPELRAVIKADRAVPHGTVVHVLDLLKQAGVGRIAFGVSPTAR